MGGKKPSHLLQPLPWYPWNPRQWQASRKVARMDWAAKGIYHDLLDECWFKGAIQASVQGIADLLSADPAEIEHAYPQFIACFDLQADGTMISPSMEAVRSDRDAYRLAQAKRRLGKVRASANEAVTGDNAGYPRLSTDNPGYPGITGVKEKRRGEERREEKRVPLLPEGSGEGEGEKPKRRTRDQIMQPYPESVRTVANAVLAAGFWRRKDPDGRLIDPDPSKLCINLDLIFKNHPSLTPELLIQAARAYLNKPRKAYSAPQWFFGKGTHEEPAHWFTEVRMLQHQASRAAQVLLETER